MASKKSATYKKGDKHKCFMLGEDTETFGEGKKLDILDKGQYLTALCAEYELTDEQWRKSWAKICDYDASVNKNSFAGNPIVYHHYLMGLLDTRYKGGATMLENYAKEPQKYWDRVCRMDRRKGFPPNVKDVFELNRTIVFFKPTTAKFLVEHLIHKGGMPKDQRGVVYDPCAGWGGRALGTMSAGHKYIGQDTNPKVIQYFNHMKAKIVAGGDTIHGGCCPQMVAGSRVQQGSCLDKSDFPFACNMAFTSPPYGNLEVYEGMSPFVDDDDYYKNFLIPMIKKCFQMVKDGCAVAINISPKIYETLVGRYEFPIAFEKIDFLQQMGQQSGKKVDYTYIWYKGLCDPLSVLK